MEYLGPALVLIGGILSLVAFIQVVIRAFKTSVGWGIGTLLLFVPVGLIFIFMNWSQTKKAFFLWLLAVVLMVVGAVLSPKMNMENLPSSAPTMNP